MGEKSFGKIPHLGPLTTRLAILGLLSLVAVGLESDENVSLRKVESSTSTPVRPDNEAAQRAALQASIERLRAVCLSFDPKHIAQRTNGGINIESRHFNRMKILDDLKKVGRCFDPHATEFNFGGVCEKVVKGWAENKKGFHPRLFPLYDLFYRELCNFQPQAKTSQETVKTVHDLRTALDAKIIEQSRLLNAPTVREICREAVSFAVQGEAEILIITRYIFANKDKFPESLKDLIAGSSSNSVSGSSKKDTPALADAEKLIKIEKQLNDIAKDIFIGAKCMAPDDMIRGVIAKGLSREEFYKRRAAAPAIIKEFLEVLSKDTSEGGKIAGDAALALLLRLK